MDVKQDMAEKGCTTKNQGCVIKYTCILQALFFSSYSFNTGNVIRSY